MQVMHVHEQYLMAYVPLMPPAFLVLHSRVHSFVSTDPSTLVKQIWYKERNNKELQKEGGKVNIRREHTCGEAEGLGI